MRIRKKREPTFRHGVLALGGLAAAMFVGVVGLGAEPQIPLVFGCIIAGSIAMYLGYHWDDIVDGMIRGIADSLEAILILLCIGMLIGVWIKSGTVPTMIVYGLMAITPGSFLPATFIITLLVGLVLGSWGAAGTIGIAFLSIGAALNVPLPMTAGTIVGASYVSEIVSPLVDGPILMAAASGTDVFDLCKTFLPTVIITCVGCCIVYFMLGHTLDTGGFATSPDVEALLASLRASYATGPVTLIPLAVMIICVIAKVPAIPTFLAAVIIGMIEAVCLQGADSGSILACANTGVVSNTGFETLDSLLTNGGMQIMMPTVSIVLLVMAYAGIMQHTCLMDALFEPIVSRLHGFGALVTAAVASGTLFNILLPDQYPAIVLSAQMYRDEFRHRCIKDTLWANIVNSSAGITSVIVPWNTCAIYMVTILGVSCFAYAPYACFCYLYPIVVILVSVFGFASFLPLPAKKASL